ncbi:hypothetical protein [Roseinatronobacter sp. S2]|uniref:hypothetical protein n=1 Tax=Roseinatronobacter sp. S2 TaxID=3035471 RepID=UPI00241065E6|nr:hypothetical protein [Roseinatronobacter sp. S2]WFE74187.1 hypothetical protein P8S53_13490 [Roseinatronobacter sp. S2]
MATAIYIAHGLPYLAMLLSSLRGLRTHNPDIDVVVAARIPKPVLPDHIWGPRDRWICVPDDHDMPDHQIAKRMKMDLPDLTLSERSFFLDCDTLVHRPLAPFLRQLDHFDVLLRPHIDPELRSNATAPTGTSYKVGELPHWNSGVIFFRKSEASAELFKLWGEYFDALGLGLDQPSLAGAVAKSAARVGPLPRVANAFTGDLKLRDVRESCYVHHYTSNIDADLCKALEAEMNSLASMNGWSVDDTSRSFFQNRIAGRLARGKSLSGHGFWRRLAARMVKQPK